MTPTVSAPPAAPIKWTAWRLFAPSRPIVIEARLWFEARAEAMRRLGCERAELFIVVRDQP